VPGGEPGQEWLPILSALPSGRKLPPAASQAHNSTVRGALDTESVAAAATILDGEEEALDAFAAVAAGLLRERPSAEALERIATAAAVATRSDAAILRTAAPGGKELLARVVKVDTSALAAELEGSRLPSEDVPVEEVEVEQPATSSSLAPALRRAAARVRADVALVYPIFVDDAPAATLELMRVGPGYSARERMLGRLAAAHVGIVVRLDRAGRGGDGRPERSSALELVGDALAAGADEGETAEQIVRVAAELTGAAGAALWRVEADTSPSLLATQGDGDLQEKTSATEAVRQAVRERRIGFAGPVVTVPLGEPPAGAVQLSFPHGAPSESELELLSPFTARAALALRRSRRVALIAVALKRSQTVIGVVSQAIARLSLAHTLDTAVERIAELTGSEHVAVYLREGERLSAAASRGLEGAHPELAERLLEIALGPYRSRGFLFIENMRRDPRLHGLEEVLEESGISRAILVPLVVKDEVIGALGVFKARPRPYREGEEGLLIALSSQLAVAVQNARLHERTKELGEVLERTLESERKTARQLRGLYEISRSFTESLSLQATLDAVAKTMVDLFEIDAAAIRMPDERGDVLETHAIHVADSKFREAATAILSRPQPMTAPLARRLLRSGRPVLLVPGTAEEDDVHRLLDPFLVKGSTAAVLPMAKPGEILGTLTLLSLDPARPLEQEDVDSAMAVAAQAALAIDNARLYQQQKDFSETMQRSLLPRELPAVPGLDVGHLYESSARVDVGGDVYDFLTLERGRLAVFLGDVTGKGIEAAADMAMAKFSFRALARKWPDPSPFLSNANEVIVDEIGTGKFITMVYVLVDPSARKIACASAGHPPPRIIAPDGKVSQVAARGLALGVEPDQKYATEQVELAPGSAVVLYTDGVIEARRDGELYGEGRLDKALRKHRKLGAQALAEAVLAECRSFSGGDLADDCAIVVMRLAP
jgi:serine phosphatase RsbU (regulator of sigma subunit)